MDTAGGSPIPESLGRLRVDRFSCLGSTLTFLDGSGDEDEVSWQAARVPILTDAPADASCQALRQYVGRFRELKGAGLSAQSAFALLRTFANGAVIHLQRGSHTSEAWCHAFDMEVVHFMEELLECTLDDPRRTQMFLPLKLGGCGVGSACAKRHAAYVASWEQCLAEVSAAVG